MRIYQSWLGCVLSLIYTVSAVYVIQDELRHTGGGWINLRGLGTLIITFPSQLTLGLLLEWAGVPKLNFNEPGASDYIQLVLHVLVTATIIYLIGYGLEWILRRLLLSQAAR